MVQPIPKYYGRRFLSVVLVLSLVCGFTPSPHVPGSSSNVVKSFDKIARLYQQFLSTDRPLIYKQSYSDSPTGVTAEVYRYSAEEMSYDVYKTRSLVSPYVAYITAQVYSPGNGQCGDVSFGPDYVDGYTSVDSAVAHSNVETCYPQTGFELEGEEIRFDFAYQSGRWELKSVTRVEEDIPEVALTAILIFPISSGLTITERSGIALNKPWQALRRR